MKYKKLTEQSEIVDKVFHQILFSIMFSQQDGSGKSAKRLSFMEMRIMGLAYENPDIILKEIRDIVCIPQTTLSSIIAKLEKMGILKRVLNSRDMRSFSLEVTKQGKKMVAEHYRKDIEAAEKMLFSLDKSEREEFVRMLEKISVSFGGEK